MPLTNAGPAVALNPDRYVEIHIHADTQQVRHCLTDFPPFRIHSGFTVEDAGAGWRQVKAFFADKCFDLDVKIELAKEESLAHLRSYWQELAEAPVRRVIRDGEHYVMHELGEGIGFGGRAFRIGWLTPGQEPTICNLSGQGRIPVWMRTRLPDNARVIEDLGGGHDDDFLCSVPT